MKQSECHFWETPSLKIGVNARPRSIFHAAMAALARLLAINGSPRDSGVARILIPFNGKHPMLQWTAACIDFIGEK
jgi:hypothetical protein